MRLKFSIYGNASGCIVLVANCEKNIVNFALKHNVHLILQKEIEIFYDEVFLFHE